MNLKPYEKTPASQKSSHIREKIDILYKDQYLAVIYKPAGILSVPYPGSRNKTAQSVLEDMLRKTGTANTHHRPYAVHRLDRDTSGVMMFALTENAREKIMNTWHKMVTGRIYRAVAEISNDAENLPDSGSIDDPIAQNAHNVGFVPGKKVSGDKKSGLEFKTVPARTNYKIILRGQAHVLFELSLDTGKKNQIRAHLAAHGYPVAGDKEHRSHTDHFGRLCLHARTLEFNHPFTGGHLKFEVEEPPEWAEYVKHGDKNTETPSRNPARNVSDIHRSKKSFGSSRKAKRSEAPQTQPGQKRLSGKEKAHMNFIESGKKFRK